MTPFPAGEGWGEENKVRSFSPHPAFSLWRRLLNGIIHAKLMAWRDVFEFWSLLAYCFNFTESV